MIRDDRGMLEHVYLTFWGCLWMLMVVLGLFVIVTVNVLDCLKRCWCCFGNVIVMFCCCLVMFKVVLVLFGLVIVFFDV